jgi:hypothetical protein
LSTVSLSGEWEVGLSEIIFPHTWLTLDKEEAVFTISCSEELNYAGCGEFHKTVRMAHGYYTSVRDVVEEINKCLSGVVPIDTNRPFDVNLLKQDRRMSKLKYNDTSKKVHFLMQAGQVFTFTSALATILGVADSQNPVPEPLEHYTSWVGRDVGDVSRGINYLMVYCDLLEHVSVGDTKVPLLRIVNASGVNGEIVHHCYDTPRYTPLLKKNFSSIEMLIRDDLGRPIAFENGKLIVTLHFRQSKNAYFL